MSVLVNGAAREVDAGTTLAALVASLTAAASGVAVARNDEVVPRGEWGSTHVADGDRIEVLTAVQGG